MRPVERLAKEELKKELMVRCEKRFLVDEDRARAVMQAVSRNLEPARTDCLFPWRITTYCDTPDWRLYRSAVAGAGTRLRFREYHIGRPEEAFGSATTWLEVKEALPSGRKARVGILSSAIPALLRGDAQLPAALNGLGEQVQLLVAAHARPVLVTRYCRLAYAAPGDRIRITADYDLSYLAIPWAASDDGAVPCRLGPVLGTESGTVIEIKYSDELPDWAVAILGSLSEPTTGEQPSKFVVGVRHLRRHLHPYAGQ